MLSRDYPGCYWIVKQCFILYRPSSLGCSYQQRNGEEEVMHLLYHPEPRPPKPVRSASEFPQIPSQSSRVDDDSQKVQRSMLPLHMGHLKCNGCQGLYEGVWDERVMKRWVERPQARQLHAPQCPHAPSRTLQTNSCTLSCRNIFICRGGK